jgi:subtilisin family serine protease
MQTEGSADGVWIVLFSSDVGQPEAVAERMARDHGSRVRRIYRHGVTGFSASLAPQAVEALRRNPQVALIGPNVEVAPLDHSTQLNPWWGLDRVDQRTLPLSSSYDYSATGLGVHAYVFDDALRLTHTEFGGRASFLYDAQNEGGQLCAGHGTHVGGILGGATAGIAKSVSLHSVKVFGCGLTKMEELLAAIDFVRGNHIKPAVANMSLAAIDGYGNEVGHDVLDSKVRDLIAAGVTVVAGAGNQSKNACGVSPARVAEAITVGSTTSTDARAGTSNIGTCLDLFAPGDNIRSAYHSSDNAFTNMGGTSMAAPHVAGAVALYLQANPAATPAQVSSALVSRATTGVLTNIGSGSPNRLLYTLPPLTAAIDGRSYISSPGTYTWNAVTTGGIGHVTYLWERINTSGYTTRHTIGTGPSESIYINGGPDFYLILTVTSANQSVTVQQFVNNATTGSCTFRC